MEQIQKEKEENVGGKKPTEKKMKFYKVLSLVLGILLCLVLMNQCAESCARHNINYTARTNEIDRRITDVIREKEKVDGMKMDYYVYYTFANSDRCGLMDKDGNRLTEPVYSKIEALNEHLFSFFLLDGETQFVKSL